MAMLVGAAVVGLSVLLVSGQVQAQGPASEEREVVIVVLQNQEQVDIARTVQAEYQLKLNALSQAVQSANVALNGPAELTPPVTQDGELAYVRQVAVTRPASEEAQAAHDQAVAALEAAQAAMRREIVARSAPARQASQDALVRLVEDLGGEVIYRYSTVNAMAVAVSPTARADLEAHPAVAAIYDDKLLESQLDVSAEAMGADIWWGAGFNGNPFDVAVVDSGIDDTHPALASHSFTERRCLAGAGNPPWDPTADDISGHGTHVAGIVASTNSAYRGIAYGLRNLINAKAAYDTDGVVGGPASMSFSMACVDWALTLPQGEADVINLSYGGLAVSDDGGVERFWDAVVDQMYAVVAMAAGNSGPGDYTISTPSIAYNVISVANVNDNNTVSRADDAVWISSSRGPTPGGRKKPDLAAPGTHIWSTYSNWEGSNPDFVAYTGTSMAAPHVAGAAMLLMDAGVTDPMAIKALLINAAQDRGSAGWDTSYGWGYIDLGHLADHIHYYFIDSVAANPAYKLYAGPVSAADTASLVWNRRAVYNGAAYPGIFYTLTDLDLLMYEEANNSMLDSSISWVDNVEQVKASSVYGSVVAKVDSWSSSIGGTSTERYVLAVEKIFEAKRGPALEVVLTAVSGDIGGPAGTIIEARIKVGNTGDLKAHNVRLNMTYSDGLTKLSGGDSFSIGGLDAGSSSSTYYWRFRKDDDSAQHISWEATSSSYGESFVGSRMLGAGKIYLPIILRNS